MQSDEEIREKICQGRRNKAGPRSFLTKAATLCFRTFIASFYVFFILELLALKMNGALAVPDPEPRLLCKCGDSSKTTTAFSPFRKIRGLDALHSRQGPFQLFKTPGNTGQHLPDLPQLH